MAQKGNGSKKGNANARSNRNSGRKNPAVKKPQKNQAKPVRGTKGLEPTAWNPGNPEGNGMPPRPPREKVVSLESHKKQRGRSRGRSELVVLSVSLFLFAICVGGSLFKFVTRDDIATMTVPYGSVDASKYIRGIIIRDETVYRSSGSGEVSFNVADTDRVKKGTVVCSVRNETVVAALEAEKEQVSKKILETQDMRTHVSAVSSDVAVINNKIKTEVNKNNYKFVGNDLSSVYTLKSAIEDNIEYRNDLLLNENWGSVEGYVDANRQYTNRISELTDTIAVNTGGIVSYVIDGFEELLNFSNMESVSREQTQMAVPIESANKTKAVEENQEVFKIVSSNDWYIAAYIDNDLVRDWNEGSTVKIYVERDTSYEELDVRVEQMNRMSDDSFVILRAAKKMIDYLDMRTVSFKTHDSIFSGIKIPETAIVERTFLKVPSGYVQTVRGNYVVSKQGEGRTQEVYINPKSLKNTDPEDGFLYVMQDFNNLKRGDVIYRQNEDGAQEEYQIQDIITSKGVFKANNGTAVFVSIDAENMIAGSNGYVILDSDTNSGQQGVNIYDRIVSDAQNANVEEGDFIY